MTHPTRSAFCQRMMATSYGVFLASAVFATVLFILSIWTESLSDVLVKLLGTSMSLAFLSFSVMVGTRSLELRN